MTKKRRVYRPRFVGGKIMMQALERLHKYMIDVWIRSMVSLLKSPQG
jgi:hypothetical protein